MTTIEKHTYITIPRKKITTELPGRCFFVALNWIQADYLKEAQGFSLHKQSSRSLPDADVWLHFSSFLNLPVSGHLSCQIYVSKINFNVKQPDLLSKESSECTHPKKNPKIPQSQTESPHSQSIHLEPGNIKHMSVSINTK